MKSVKNLLFSFYSACLFITRGGLAHREIGKSSGGLVEGKKKKRMKGNKKIKQQEDTGRWKGHSSTFHLRKDTVEKEWTAQNLRGPAAQSRIYQTQIGPSQLLETIKMFGREN